MQRLFGADLRAFIAENALCSIFSPAGFFINLHIHTVSEKISDIMADKTGSGVPLASFVDPRNTGVESVQFVITTPAIRVKTVQTEAASAPDNSGILQKIRDLFR